MKSMLIGALLMAFLHGDFNKVQTQSNISLHPYLEGFLGEGLENELIKAKFVETFAFVYPESAFVRRFTTRDDSGAIISLNLDYLLIKQNDYFAFNGWANPDEMWRLEQRIKLCDFEKSYQFLKEYFKKAIIEFNADKSETDFELKLSNLKNAIEDKIRYIINEVSNNMRLLHQRDHSKIYTVCVEEDNYKQIFDSLIKVLKEVTSNIQADKLQFIENISSINRIPTLNEKVESIIEMSVRSQKDIDNTPTNNFFLTGDYSEFINDRITEKRKEFPNFVQKFAEAQVFIEKYKAEISSLYLTFVDEFQSKDSYSCSKIEETIDRFFKLFNTVSLFGQDDEMSLQIAATRIFGVILQRSNPNIRQEFRLLIPKIINRFINDITFHDFPPNKEKAAYGYWNSFFQSASLWFPIKNIRFSDAYLYRYNAFVMTGGSPTEEKVLWNQLMFRNEYVLITGVEHFRELTSSIIHSYKSFRISLFYTMLKFENLTLEEYFVRYYYPAFDKRDGQQNYYINVFKLLNKASKSFDSSLPSTEFPVYFDQYLDQKYLKDSFVREHYVELKARNLFETNRPISGVKFLDFKENLTTLRNAFDFFQLCFDRKVYTVYFMNALNITNVKVFNEFESTKKALLNLIGNEYSTRDFNPSAVYLETAETVQYM